VTLAIGWYPRQPKQIFAFGFLTNQKDTKLKHEYLPFMKIVWQNLQDTGLIFVANKSIAFV